MITGAITNVVGEDSTVDVVSLSSLGCSRGISAAGASSTIKLTSIEVLTSLVLALSLKEYSEPT